MKHVQKCQQMIGDQGQNYQLMEWVAVVAGLGHLVVVQEWEGLECLG